MNRARSEQPASAQYGISREKRDQHRGTTIVLEDFCHRRVVMTGDERRHSKNHGARLVPTGSVVRPTVGRTTRSPGSPQFRSPPQKNTSFGRRELLAAADYVFVSAPSPGDGRLKSDKDLANPLVGVGEAIGGESCFVPGRTITSVGGWSICKGSSTASTSA